jgi:hypothetical protein
VALILAQVPLWGTVAVVTIRPSVASPQPLGTPVTWEVLATDTNASSLTFQFNVSFNGQSFALARDYNVGKKEAGIWAAQPLAWNSISGEGVYTIQVIAKDFASGETATQSANFTLTSRAPSGATVSAVENPLVALFSAPLCAAGSTMRVAFFTGANPTSYTSWTACQPPLSMNFYVAGMLPSTPYTMFSQVQTGSTITNGSNLTFTTGALPAHLGLGYSLPALTVEIPAGPRTDTTDAMVLWGFTNNIVPVATDLSGNIDWFYASGVNTMMTRPLSGGTLLVLQDGLSWNSSNQTLQMLREVDLAGNIVRETNTGVLSQQLMAMGATDAGSCVGVVIPAPVGTACLNDLSHDAIRYTIDGAEYTALLAHVEKIFPAGTQGSNPSGPPVDILSEMLIVLDAQWQVVWYYDSFQQLDISRAAVLGEICDPAAGQGADCALTLLLATSAQDWTHGNCIYYMPSTGDFLVSLRDQDWLIKVDYNNGAGAGDIIWRMGQDGDFTFVNVNADPWPWFSHQHDAGYENSGNGPLTMFDNGNTRVSAPPLGLGKSCGPSDCHSRGMALTVDETARQVTPVLSVELAFYASYMGSAQLLFDGNYFFSEGAQVTDGIEILPTPGTIKGTEVLNLSSPHTSYRCWQMPTLYDPPIT